MLSVLGRNLPLKLLSIAFALFLWFLISGGQGGEEMEISIGIPVELHNLPPEMEVVKGPVERVDVRLSGPRRVVSRVSQMGINIQLDLNGAAEGETKFELFTSDIKVPEGVTVSRVSPSSVDVHLERALKKEVDIILPIQGSPMQGFRVHTTEIIPGKMEIKGPRSQIVGIKGLKTTPVDIGGASEDIEGETTVILPEDSQIQAVNRSSVRYRITLEKLTQKEEENGG